MGHPFANCSFEGADVSGVGAGIWEGASVPLDQTDGGGSGSIHLALRTTELHFKQQGRNLLAPSVCARRNTQTHMLEHTHACVQTHMLLLELS